MKSGGAGQGGGKSNTGRIAIGDNEVRRFGGGKKVVGDADY